MALLSTRGGSSKEVDFVSLIGLVVDGVSSVRSITVSVFVDRRGWRRVESWVLGSGEALPEEEGTVCALASILRAIPVVFGVGSGDPPSPKLNKLEKSSAFPFPLLFEGLLFLKVVPADWERMIGSGCSIRRDLASEVSLAGDEVFLILLTVAAVRRGKGRIQ